MRCKVGLLLLLPGVGRPALAQLLTSADSLRPRLTLGVQAALYPRLALTADGATGGSQPARPWPVLLTVSYHTYRYSSEAGLLLRADPATVHSYATSGGTYTYRSTGRTWAVPVVGRLRMAPQRPQRWRLDAVAGALLLHSRYQQEITFRDARTGQESASGSSSLSYEDLPLLAGAGATYQLTPRFGLTADARVTWSVLATVVGRIFNGSYVAPVTPALSLGGSWTFGQPTPWP